MKRNIAKSASELQFQIFFEQFPFSTQIFSPDGKTIQVNKAWESLWKVTLSQLKDYNILKDRQLEELGIMPLIKKGFSGVPTNIPVVNYNPEKTLKDITNTTPLWVRAFIYPVLNQKKQVQEVILIHEDISHQIQDENKLKESEERFRSLIEQSTDAIQLVTPEGKVIYSSESIKNVLGYTPEELKGASAVQFLHPDDLPYFTKKLQELIKKPKSEVTLQYRVKHKDGTWAWLETTGVNHLETPNINALVGTFRNITKRREHEEELRYQKTVLETQQEVSPEGILVVSPEGKIVSYNTRFLKLWNFSEELVSEGVDELALLNATRYLVDPIQFLRRIQEIYKSHKPSFDELNFKDGRVFDRYGSPLIGEDGTNYGYVWFFQDVTQRKQLERQKDEFLGIASHELKTPITSLKAFGQVIQSRLAKSGDERSVILLGKMDAQINKLTNLIRDLLDISKIVGGRLQFHNAYFFFDEVVAEIVEEVQRTTERHTLHINGKTGKTIWGDRERV